MLAHVEHALDERHRSEQQVRQFVADASHELRTPLTTIHGYAELSRRTRPADPEQLSLAMTKVEAEATRMSSLVEDLLLLARLDAGRPLARDEVDLTRLVLEAVGDARVVGPTSAGASTCPTSRSSSPGDEQRLHQVVTNLLNNARRHTPAGHDGDRRRPQRRRRGRDLRAGRRARDCPRTWWHRAFERFTRGDSSRTRGVRRRRARAVAGAGDRRRPRRLGVGRPRSPVAPGSRSGSPPWPAPSPQLTG